MHTVDRCSICGSVFEPWLSMPIDPKKEQSTPFGDLIRCSHCSYGSTQVRPDAELIEGFYDLDSYYTHGVSHFADPGAITLLDKIRVHLAWRLDFGTMLDAALIAQLIGDGGLDVLDIGCGDGSLARSLMDSGHRVKALELDRNAAAMARAKGIDVIESSVESLNAVFFDQQFDVIIMSHVLEHLLQPVTTVESVAKLLLPGGIFLCVVPNNACMGLRYSSLAWEPLDVPRHLNFFTPGSLARLVGNVGLLPERTFFNGYCRQFSNAWIQTERRIHRAIVTEAPHSTPSMRPNSKSRAWRLLIRTAFASASSKYDSVAVVGRKS